MMSTILNRLRRTGPIFLYFAQRRGAAEKSLKNQISASPRLRARIKKTHYRKTHTQRTLWYNCLMQQFPTPPGVKEPWQGQSVHPARVVLSLAGLVISGYSAQACALVAIVQKNIFTTGYSSDS